MKKLIYVMGLVLLLLVAAACGGTPTATLTGAGIDPTSVTLDTMGLPYSWQANLVPATPYDASQPPGPMGLPEHIQINFGVTDPKDKQFGDPVIYIIPVEAYKQLWESAGSQSVTMVLEKLQTLLAEKPSPILTHGMPVLPYEEIGGVNDLAVQGKYVDWSMGNGARFVGRFVQDPNPVTNQRLRYIFQGLSDDGQYLVAFFYPVTTNALPRIEDVSDEEMQRVNSDLEAYMQEKTEMLNALPESDWDPDLALLDSVLASLTYQTTQ